MHVNFGINSKRLKWINCVHAKCAHNFKWINKQNRERARERKSSGRWQPVNNQQINLQLNTLTHTCELACANCVAWSWSARVTRWPLCFILLSVCTESSVGRFRCYYCCCLLLSFIKSVCHLFIHTFCTRKFIQSEMCLLRFFYLFIWFCTMVLLLSIHRF